MQVTSIHNLMVSSSLSYSVHRLLQSLASILTMDSQKDQHYVISVPLSALRYKKRHRPPIHNTGNQNLLFVNSEE